MARQQFNNTIDEEVINKVKTRAINNTQLFGEDRRGSQSRAVEIFLELGMEKFDQLLKEGVFINKKLK
jgi:hypothetical protein